MNITIEQLISVIDQATETKEVLVGSNDRYNESGWATADISYINPERLIYALKSLKEL